MSSELSELASLIRAHLEFEKESGSLFVPPFDEAREESSRSERMPSPAAAPRLVATDGSIAIPAPASAAISGVQKKHALDVIAAACASCTACRLHEGRTRSVFSRGSPDAVLAFVGEGPGYHEDQEGLPFVGAAGQLLDKMVSAMGFHRDDVYICNVVKCRPPENRTPLPDEAAACEPFLTRQLDLVAPQVIVALGKCAAENLGCVPPSGRWRGVWGTLRGTPVMPTYHPAYLLRSPEQKKPVWEDLQQVVAKLGRTLPGRKS